MSDTKFFAKKYIGEGWSVIPIPRGEKGPRTPNWQNTTFGEDAFSGDENIGVRLGAPSANLVDIDLDAQEAVDAAQVLLLKTERVSGRPGKPRSHYWYISPDTKAEQFKDVDGAVLVEIRGTGQQTVLPPSIHPTGEAVRWEEDGRPNEVPALSLRESARLVATAALLARHWPTTGSRHDLAGLAAGFLASQKLPGIDIEMVIRTAATIANDDDVNDRARFARDSVDAYIGGKKVRGGPELAKIIGEEPVKLLRKWFGTTQSAIEELNAKHAVIFQQSGDLIVITEDADLEGRPFLRFSSPETIRQLYPQLVPVGQTSKGLPQYKPLGAAWFNSQYRRSYNGIELAPNGRNTPGYYNLWRGFTVEPKKGSWAKYRRHIENVVCSGNEEIIHYVLCWMAQCVQKPGTQANTAIALRGGQGTGKGSYVRHFGNIFGVHFVHLDSTRHLTGGFNAHLHNAILVFADEAAWPGDKAGLGALKRMITEPTLAIERKGKDIFSVTNMMHLLMASNEEWTVPAAMDERRFVVIDVSPDKQNDTNYFQALEDEMTKGGSSAMLYDLLEMKIDIDLRIIPKTKALYDQKRLTSSIQKRWWYQVLFDGDMWHTNVPGTEDFRIDRAAMYDNYVNTLDRAGQRQKSIQTELGMFLKKMLPEPYPQSFRGRTSDGWLPREWIFPPLATCRQYYETQYGITTEAEWPTSDTVGDVQPQLRGNEGEI